MKETKCESFDWINWGISEIATEAKELVKAKVFLAIGYWLAKRRKRQKPEPVRISAELTASGFSKSKLRIE